MKTVPYTSKDFDWVRWTPKRIEKEAEVYIENLKKTIDAIKAVPLDERTFENTFFPLAGNAQWDKGVGERIYVLKDLHPKETVRDAASSAILIIQKVQTDLWFDEGLYQAFLEYKFGSEQLEGYEEKFVKDTLRDMKRMGFHLAKEDRKKLKTLKKKLHELESDFSRTLADYEDHILVSKDNLGDLPDTYVQGLQKEKEKYKVSLSTPEFQPFMKLCSNPKLRKKLADKYAMRGGKGNIKRLTKIFVLRHQIAQLLGYKNFADYNIESKMAKKTSTVMAFLNKQIKLLKPLAKVEFMKVRDFRRIHEEDRKADLAYYDGAYYDHLYKQSEFDVDTEALKEYFPLDSVRDYAFNLFKKHFDIRFAKSNLPMWDKSVDVFEVKKGSSLLGYVAFDLFYRKGKHKHPCAYGIEGYSISPHLPAVSVMNAVLSTPTKTTPALMSLYDIEVFFHEFGHILHNILSKALLRAQAGAQVPYDFVEVPSQFVEEWGSAPEYLVGMSKHYKTGKKLSKRFLSALESLRFWGQAGSWLRTSLLGKLDILYHTNQIEDTLVATHDRLMKSVFPYKDYSEKSLFPGGWGHMSSDSYGAGYYGYVWAKAMAVDCWEEYQKTGGSKGDFAKRFMDEVLAVGSSRDEMESLEACLGRPFDPDAFSRYLSGK